MYLLKERIVSSMIGKVIFLCILFSACTPKKPETTPEERQKIQSFLNQFLFVEGAVYALFGDKPISQMLVFIGNDADRAELSEEQLKTAIFVDDSTVANWKAWQHFIGKIPSKHFILAERPCMRDTHHVIYSLLNIKRVKDVLAQYRPVFEQKIGSHFDIEQVIQQFKDPQSSFWRKAFADHYLSGLLFGYGEENIAYFMDPMKDREIENEFSDESDPCATAGKFPIPIFATSACDQTSKRYREQREAIQEIYRGKDIVDVTMQRYCN